MAAEKKTKKKNKKKKNLTPYANSEGPDQTAHAQSGLGLRCSPKNILYKVNCKDSDKTAWMPGHL